MKKEFFGKPDLFKEEYDNEFESFAWQDFLTAIPSPLFIITSYKKNGKENACLQSWSTFVGDKGEFICIIGSVSKMGHLYNTLVDNNECVINFPSESIYKKCLLTVSNNGYEDNEITKSGLTCEKAIKVNAPRIKECFLNIECEVLWIKEHFQDSRDVTVALKSKHICMDSEFYDETKTGRYKEQGYLYNIHSPRNPDTGENSGTYLGAIKKIYQY